MNRVQRLLARVTTSLVLLIAAWMLVPSIAGAQDEAGIQPEPDTVSATPASVTGEPPAFENTFQGEFRPGKGFDLIKTKRGTVNISVYGLFRWMNQMPGEQTYQDHLGRDRTVKSRNDLNWHRSMVWVSGWFYVPEFRYTLTVWSLASTQQTLIFGNMMYRFAPQATLGIGIAPNLTARSMTGTWPYWGGSDRQMSEEFMRGGFSSGVFLTGQALPRFYYNGSVNTNLSQLGVTASNDTRDMAYSGTLWWLPTTGEFGPRAGFGDLEHHTQLATRLGVSGCTSRESRYAPLDAPPNATQIRLSDGVYPFEAGALAEGVTVTSLDYHYIGADAGAKYRGLSLQGEFYYRTLSNFDATGPLPTNYIKDRAFMLQAGHMVIPKTLMLYATYGRVYDQFERNPWEVSGGASFYPSHSRAWRVNLHVNRIEKSPTGSSFGYYSAGQSGTTVSLGADILL